MTDAAASSDSGFEFRRGHLVMCTVAVLVTVSSVARAQAQNATDKASAFDLSTSSRTYFQVYQRALSPGPAGSTIDTELLAPVHQYVYARGDRIDVPGAEDSLGFELSAWASLGLAGDDLGHNPDGDVTIANVFHRRGPAKFTLGRQVQTAGAARFARFDGMSVDLRADSGLTATGYGGFTVLPRWDARPSYHHLGAVFDTLVEDTDVLPEPTRSGNWLAGARVGYQRKVWTAGVGFHEQRTSAELERRNGALDFLATPVETVDVSGRVIVDVDAGNVADARLATDLYPIEPLLVGLEFRRVVPHLLLSKQSILSVFGSDAFNEVGGQTEWQASDQIELGGGQWVELLGEGEVGARTQLWARAYPESSRRIVLQWTYGRVVEPANGYHSTRLSARWQVATPVAVIAEQYAYFYDEAINGYELSAVEALNTEYAGSLPIRLLLSGTLAHTPYAAHDAQVLLRMTYDFERQEGGT